jgi:hypothetical protein
MNRAVDGPQIETLRRVTLFEDLDAAELQAIADSMHEANVPAGAVVTARRGQSIHRLESPPVDGGAALVLSVAGG